MGAFRAIISKVLCWHSLTWAGGDCWDGRDTATSIDRVGSGELKLSLQIPIESLVVEIKSCE